MIVELEKTQGRALSYLIARAIWPKAEILPEWFDTPRAAHHLPALDTQPGNPIPDFNPQEDWAFSGPFLAAHNIFPSVWLDGERAYSAELPDCVYREGQLTRIKTLGPTPLIAAWRCFVAWRLGIYSGYSEVRVEIPDCLMTEVVSG